MRVGDKLYKQKPGVGNLTSRSKELREQIDELEWKRLELAESIRDTQWNS